MSLGNKMMTGVLWSGAERIAIQSIQFIIVTILARILTPTEYGVVGLLMVFISVSNVFINSGFTTALVQKKNRTQEDISTVFIFNIAISILCYLILWISAPYIAEFYQNVQLIKLLRVLAFSLVISSFFNVPYTLFTIDLDFKTIAKSNLIATITSGSIAIYLAYQGFGAWALVLQTVITSAVSFCLIWYFTKWKPILIFSKASFKGLFVFGSKLLISSILDRIVNDIASLMIGKTLSTKDLGYYSRGIQNANFVSSTVSAILDRVLLPGLTEVQDDLKLLIEHIKRILKITALITVPIFFGLLVLAEPIILVLLTEKWLIAVPIMQIFCVARLITILSRVNITLLYVIGRTDLALKQQYVKLAIRIVFLFVALKYGIIYVAIAELISTTIHYFINSYYPGKIMNYGAFKQIKDNSLIFISGILMAIGIYFAIFFIDNNIVKLIVGFILGVLIYYGMIRLFKIEEYQFLKQKLEELKK